MSNTLYSRISNLFDTETNWNDIGDTFIPKAGELVIYKGKDNKPARFKIGDGRTALNILNFASEAELGSILDDDFYNPEFKFILPKESTANSYGASAIGNDTKAGHLGFEITSIFINNGELILTINDANKYFSNLKGEPKSSEFFASQLVLADANGNEISYFINRRSISEKISGSTTAPNYTFEYETFEYDPTTVNIIVPYAYNSLNQNGKQFLNSADGSTTTSGKYKYVVDFEEIAGKIDGGFKILKNANAEPSNDGFKNQNNIFILLNQPDAGYYPTGYFAQASTWNAHALGRYSVCEGQGSITQGRNTHAEGSTTAAIGNVSHAEGSNTATLGKNSHAEGRATLTEYAAEYSHAEGYETVTHAKFSHAEGYWSEAKGEGSHAEGYSTQSKGAYSHSEGLRSISKGLYSHSEGTSTSAIGISSHAEGSNTKAEGEYSHAQGISTLAEGEGSFASGNSSIASGKYSHVEGNNTQASAQSAHAEGDNTKALYDYAHAEGKLTEARNESAHAEGRSTIASGLRSHAEGYFSTASGSYSHAEGFNSIASGENSHAEGNNTQASAQSAHAEGQAPRCNLVLKYTNPSHQDGNQYQIDANYKNYFYSCWNKEALKPGYFIYNKILYIITKVQSASSGNVYMYLENPVPNIKLNDTLTVDFYSSNIAGAAGTHVEGLGTIALSENQHVEGKFNAIDDANTYVHIVGNGSAEKGRSNAHTIDWDGNAWFAGTVSSKGGELISQNQLRNILNDSNYASETDLEAALNGYSIKVLDKLPDDPSNTTIYFIKE